MNDLEMVDHLIYFLILCYKKSPGTLFLGFKYRIWVPDFWTPLYIMQTDMFCRRGTDCVQPSAIERAHATVSVSTCVLELRREIERETCQMQPHSPNQLKSDLQLLHRTEALCVCVCVCVCVENILCH